MFDTCTSYLNFEFLVLQKFSVFSFKSLLYIDLRPNLKDLSRGLNPPKPGLNWAPALTFDTILS